MHDTAHEDRTLLVHDLELPVAEARDVLEAIRGGEVDAFVISATNEPPKVFLLRGADDAHRILLETLNEGAMTIAKDATILYANRRLSELLGRPLREVLGVPLTRFLSPADASSFMRLLADGRGTAKAEMALVTATEPAVPVMVSMRTVTGEQETCTVVLTDLTDLKTAQKALEVANDELEARVTARTAEVERANAALRQENIERARLTSELSRKAEELAIADRRKDEFLSMLAHELRNPLSPILTAAELLRAAGRNDASVERYRAVIERQTRNLTRLVDDLLEASRLTRRTLALHKQSVSMAQLVRSAIETAGPLIHALEHDLQVSLPDGSEQIVVDPTRFEQVLVNLLNNAAKYTDRGGHIFVSASLAGDEAVFRVRDTGVGIPADLLPQVFDLFVQGERSLARSQGGLGIGLTLVQRLVALHGGTVALHSDGPGKGTEAEVRIPRHGNSVSAA